MIIFRGEIHRSLIKMETCELLTLRRKYITSKKSMPRQSRSHKRRHMYGQGKLIRKKKTTEGQVGVLSTWESMQHPENHIQDRNEERDEILPQLTTHGSRNVPRSGYTMQKVWIEQQFN